jgi:hypothetical protein
MHFAHLHADGTCDPKSTGIRNWEEQYRKPGSHQEVGQFEGYGLQSVHNPGNMSVGLSPRGKGLLKLANTCRYRP